MSEPICPSCNLCRVSSRSGLEVCFDCAYRDLVKHHQRKVDEAYERGLKDGAPKWVKIEPGCEMPKVQRSHRDGREIVLVTEFCKEGISIGVYEAWLDSYSFPQAENPYWFTEHGLLSFQPTHWMPPPTPPKEEK